MVNVLMGEDDELNRDLRAHRGFCMHCSAEGEKGVALARLQPRDDIFMGMRHPITDGWEALRNYRSDPQTRTIPIIALDTQVLAGGCERGFGAGFDDFESEPVEFLRLLDKINASLHQEVSNGQ